MVGDNGEEGDEEGWKCEARRLRRGRARAERKIARIRTRSEQPIRNTDFGVVG
jgi:hypothetical protein